MRSGRLVLAAVLTVASAVRADLVPFEHRNKTSSLVRSEQVFSHVTTPGKKSWAARELERLRQKRRGPNRLGTMKLPQSASADKVASEDPLRGAMASGGVVAWSVSDYDDSAYESSASGGLELEATVNRAVADSELGDIPGIAVGVADALKQFSDSTVQLIFNLQRLLSRSGTRNVNRAVSKKADQESSHARKARKDRKRDNEEDARKELEREKARKSMKKVVTSAFRIGIGLVIGWLLWLIVRSSFQ